MVSSYRDRLPGRRSIDGYSSGVFPTQFQNSVSTLFINRHLNRGVSDFDVGQVGVIYGLWQLPKTTASLPLLRNSLGERSLSVS
jgi:hypothetical protein